MFTTGSLAVVINSVHRISILFYPVLTYKAIDSLTLVTEQFDHLVLKDLP